MEEERRMNIARMRRAARGSCRSNLLYPLALLTLLATGPLAARDAPAHDIVIDDTTEGTVYDAVLDGFPQLAPFDGTPDFGGNALGVALKSGVTEERGIAEFPLASLGELVADDVESATLTFNIDDVVATFGPGTGFDATGADTIFVFGYAGDGAADPEDFLKGSGTPLATVDTTGFGIITDASLATSGPLVFGVDVTAAIKARIDAGDSFIGFVFTTDDDQSGTSIDNLGDSALGPPGVHGSAMPFLTIVPNEHGTTTTTAPTTTATITITTMTTTTTSTTLFSSTTTTISTAVDCGDANGDGSITTTDALFILRGAVGLETCPLVVCDVDSNGQVLTGDSLRVLQAAIGLPVELACQG
jgi:hypothetical protein